MKSVENRSKRSAFIITSFCKVRLREYLCQRARRAALCANFFQTLFYIWLPLSVPGIISGVTMVFVPALTTFVISNLLGGSKILLIGNVIEQEFTKGSNWHLGSGLSLVLMIFILLSMALIAKYDKNGEGTTF